MTPELAGPFTREEAIRWSLRGLRREGPVSLSGRTQRARLDGGGYWEAEYSGVHTHTPEHVRAMRAYEAMLDQGASDVIVSACESFTAPWPNDANGKPITHYEQLPHSDGTLFSDGTGYAQTVIVVTTVSAAPFRATSFRVIRIIGASAPPLVPGMVFSIWHPFEVGPRRYVISEVVALSAVQFDIKFLPPLRCPVEAGAPLNFDRPQCLVRLKEADGFELTLAVRRIGKTSVVFEEADF